ncbi:hypothetical protein G6L37_07155 [Agrobacterium rubi]|nr:hypothetical protein [Agrobacterium rubi]NTF25144.1 hypothetical protein [Agrobacterium rubi]
MPAFNPSASRTYMKAMSGGGRALQELSASLIEEIEALRESIRKEEGGGGMCHYVTEVLQQRYGWERLGVTYLSADGEIICGGGHVVNILPDGSVLDPTRDQFGEGFSVSLIPVASDEMGRYRTEFYDDFHPMHPDSEGQLYGWADCYDGRSDADVQDDLQAARGYGWWLADRSLIDCYNKQQAAYSDERWDAKATLGVPG